ncbi:MAG: PAS domain S-box protein [Thermodesulfobacteriota bacterium]
MPLKILVVDNHPVMLTLLSRYLEGRGHLVRTAEDGITALDILSVFSPDLIFLDLIMPGISGKNLCRIIQGDVNFSHTRIVILSDAVVETDEDMTAWGASACIAKGPFTLVATHVQAILDRLENREPLDFPEKVLGRHQVSHRQITRELLVSRNHMDRILNNLDEGVLEFDRDGRILSANRSAQRLCGLPEEKLLGRHVLPVVDEKENAILKKLTDEAFASGVKTPYPELLRLNGRTVTLDLLPVPDGAKLSMMMILHDITEYKNTEEQLRQRERQYRTLVETVPHGIQENDVNGIITFSNAMHHRLLGYEPNELIGKPIWHMATSEHEADALRSYLAFLIRETPPPTPYTSCNRTKDGRLIDVQVDWNYKRDETGAVAGFIAIITDITERKKAEQALRESEERYRDLFENANDLIQIVRPDGKLIYVNRSWRQTFGYSDADIDHLTIFDLIAPDCSGQCRQTFLQVLREGNVSAIHADFIAKNGGKIIMEGSANCRKDANGKPLIIRCIFRDVTRQKELEEQLRQSQKMQAIGTLAAGIAHDFNNLLSAIMGYTQLTMMQQPRESSAHHNLEKVMQSSKRAADLVKQILTFSRPSSEHRVGIAITPLVKEAIKLLSHSLPATISIEEHITPDCPAVLADATQIQQVVMNLCTNAYHAMREKGGTLTIRVDGVQVDSVFRQLHPGLASAHCLRLMVQDTGPGIDPAIIDRIFEPYFTTKLQGEGTGLGLAVVHGIVTNHHGVITVESGLGEGATFTVYLPAHSSSTLTVGDEGENELPSLDASILFVDDNNDLAQLGQMALASIGCRVNAFTDAQEALAAFLAAPNAFDLVISDQTMPGLTGSELAGRILAIRPDLPVILCTGHSDIIDENRARAIGIRAFLMKPLQLHELARTIRAILAAPNGKANSA